MESREMNCCFAIVPDGGVAPVAVFESLEDAMDWGVRKFGDGRFAIRHVSMTEGPAASTASTAN